MLVFATSWSLRPGLCCFHSKHFLFQETPKHRDHTEQVLGRRCARTGGIHDAKRHAEENRHEAMADRPFYKKGRFVVAAPLVLGWVYLNLTRKKPGPDVLPELEAPEELVVVVPAAPEGMEAMQSRTRERRRRPVGLDEEEEAFDSRRLVRKGRLELPKLTKD